MMNRIRSQLILTFCLLALVPLTIFGLVTYETGSHRLEQDARDRLIALRDKKAGLVELWIQERLADARDAASSPPIVDYLRAPSASGLAAARQRLAHYAHDATPPLRRAYIVSAATGSVVASSRLADEGRPAAAPLRDLLEGKRQTYLGRAFCAGSPCRVVMDIAAQVSGASHKPLGAVVLEPSLTDSLTPLIQSPLGLGVTGETVLVNSQLLNLTGLRYGDRPPLSTRVKAVPFRRSLGPGEGLMSATDYHGVPVLAAYTSIPDTHWGLVVKEDQAEVEQPISDLRWLFLSVGIASLALALALGLVLARRLTRPLEALALAARRRTAGEADVLVEVSGPREIVETATAFNRMVEELERASRLKDEFLSMASHELKTPATSMKILAELAARHPEVMGAKLLEALNRQADQLAVLVNRLLEVSRIQLGRMPVELVPLDLAALAREACERPLAERRVVSCPPAGQPVMVEGDPVRLTQVFANLLDNAVKYSGEGSRIWVRVSAAEGRAVAEVADEGIGIPPEHLPHVFERFYKPGPQQSVYSGLGLGLFISKEIVERHGGRIWAESEPGKGSRFFVELPLVENKAL